MQRLPIPPPRRKRDEQADHPQPAGKGLDKSKAFFSALGFTFNARFSGEHSAFMHIVGDTIQAMLTTESFFRSLIDKPVAQAKQANEIVICLSCESRAEVDALIAKAVAAGGHLWNLVWVASEA
jgi:predicted lactoylglutathione lyase